MKFFLTFVLSVNMLNSYSQNDISSAVKLKYETSAIDAIFYADSVLNLDKNFPDSILYVLKNYKALSYQKNGNDVKAITILMSLTDLLDSSSEDYVMLLLNLSNSNVALSNYTEATNFALEALKKSETKHFVKLIASSYNTLSYIYFKNNDFEKSLDYLVSSVDLHIKENDSLKLATTYNNMAIIFNRQDQYIESLIYNNKALEISKNISDWIGVGKSYANIGRVYFFKNNYKKAIKYYNFSIKNNCKYSIVNSIPYRNIGDAYQGLNDFDSSEIYYKRALNIELKNGNSDVIQTLYNSLLKSSIIQNNFELALQFQTKIDSLNKIKLEHENVESLKMLENQYKLIDSEKELAYKKDELIKEKEINFKNKLIFGGIVISIILLFLFLYQRIKNLKLKASKEKLQLEQKVLRAQMNPHFIFNALSAIQNSLLDNDPIVSATYLSRFAKLIRQNFDFISQKNILLRDEIDALKNYLDTQKMRFEDKFDYTIKIANDIDIDLIQIPPLLLQPFVENSIEHGFKSKKNKGLITIDVSSINNLICYQIKDNGNGYSNKNNDKKLHSIDVFKKRLKLRGQKDEKTFTLNTSTNGTVIKFCLKQ